MKRLRFLRRWLAVVAVAAMAAPILTSQAGAAPIYDMRGLLAQPTPAINTDTADPAAKTAVQAEPDKTPAPMPAYSGVTRLYDMSIFLGQPSPLGEAQPTPPPPVSPVPYVGTPVTPPRPIDDMAAYSGVTRLYDVRIFFGQPYPLDPDSVIPAPPPAGATAAAPQQARHDTAEPVKEDDYDPDLGGDGDDLDPNDPFEPVNRVIFGANQFFLDYFLGPLTDVYRAVLPDILEEAVSNALDNVHSPVTLVNDLLQAEPGRAMDTTARFLINTVIGLGGTIDVAAKWGIKEHTEDFGQTLAVWGVDEGIYLVLPLLGPSNPRDVFGKYFVDSFFDPLGIWLDSDDNEDIRWGLRGLSAVDEYGHVVDDLEKIRKTSIDYYGALRSLYRQKRQTEILNNKGVRVPVIDFDVDE